MMPKNSKLITFLYLLMRDDLPCGQVRLEIKRAILDTDFTNKHLEAMAREYAEDLMKGS